MLAELVMELKEENMHLGVNQSSNLQGVLMEQINPDYAEYLHNQRWNPYSQYILDGENKKWIIKTTTEEAYNEIIVPLLNESFSHFIIKKKEMKVSVISKNLKKIPKQELLSEFYNGQGSNYICLQFLTPVSFKSSGRYVILPDLRLIYQSLMNKYSASSKNMEMFDEDTLEQLVCNSEIIRYNLKSTFFSLEGVKIPCFKGELVIKFYGSNTMAQYARLLVKFGEYSGVGIKTAMGMGAIKLKDWGTGK